MTSQGNVQQSLYHARTRGFITRDVVLKMSLNRDGFSIGDIRHAGKLSQPKAESSVPVLELRCSNPNDRTQVHHFLLAAAVLHFLPRIL